MKHTSIDNVDISLIEDKSLKISSFPDFDKVKCLVALFRESQYDSVFWSGFVFLKKIESKFRVYSIKNRKWLNWNIFV